MPWLEGVVIWILVFLAVVYLVNKLYEERK